MPATSEELFREGKLREAIAAQTAAVRAAPPDVENAMLVSGRAVVFRGGMGSQRSIARRDFDPGGRHGRRGIALPRPAARRADAPAGDAGGSCPADDRSVGCSVAAFVVEALCSAFARAIWRPQPSNWRKPPHAGASPSPARTAWDAELRGTFQDIDLMSARRLSSSSPRAATIVWVAGRCSIFLLESRPLQRPPRDLIWRPSQAHWRCAGRSRRATSNSAGPLRLRRPRHRRRDPPGTAYRLARDPRRPGPRGGPAHLPW